MIQRQFLTQTQKRFPLLLRIICLIFFLSLAACASSTPSPVSQSACLSTSSAVTLLFDYSTEKQAWIEPAVAAFNTQQGTCAHPITVKALSSGSGESMRAILDGSAQPDIWSPAGAVWLTRLNQQWQLKHSGTLVGTSANENPSLVKSPIVIAMWKPMAQALGWPAKPLGWADIARLSTTPNAWAAYGHPEWGDFKFGHTHPEESNSGLDAIIAENYAAVNKQRNLTSADVNQNSTREFVANVESSVIHYGTSTGTFATEMFEKGTDYLSAAVMYENLVVEANDGQTYKHLPYPVVAIYPREGTFYSDHPFAILHTSTVTPEKQAAARIFQDYLLSATQQQQALSYGFRPAAGTRGAPIDQAHGVDPAQPSSLLAVPDATTIDAIVTSWSQQRRKVDISLIIDHSGSMNDAVGGTSKIAGARAGLAEFVSLMGDLDNLALIQFSDSAEVLSPISLLGSKRQQLLDIINNISATGGTRLFDTISQQYQSLQNFSSNHIKALVVLTDGQDTVSTIKLGQLLEQITPHGPDQGEGIKIFTIAYGDPQGKGIDTQALIQIAQVTGGEENPGTPQTIKQVYQEISKFF